MCKALKGAAFLATVLLVALPAGAASAPNPSFEEGDAAPAGWTLAEGQGDWLSEGAAEGSRAIAATGNGDDMSYWRSEPVGFEPSQLYRIRFQVKGIDAAGGTPVTGPTFCNVDLGGAQEDWSERGFAFFSPQSITPDNDWLRFGQWHVRGTMAFDALALSPAQALHARQEGLELGEGERIDGNAYSFVASLGGPLSNYARPLARHACGFNSNRWTFGSGSEVIYRHRIEGRRQQSVRVNCSIGYYVSGELAVGVSLDGGEWREIGALSNEGSLELDVPGDMAPAGEFWVRLQGRPKQGDSGASFQVHGYEYRAAIDGEPLSLMGATNVVTVETEGAALKLDVQGLGEGMPGGSNEVALNLENTTPQTITVNGSLVIQGPAPENHTWTAPFQTELTPGFHTLRIPYELVATGANQLTFEAYSDGARAAAAASLDVPHLYSAGYGELLPSSTDDVALWRASSGWKIGRKRPAPAAGAHALIIRTARGEAEAAQLVVRPNKPLSGLTVTAGDLEGPDGAVIAAANVELLRVAYVEIQQPTDKLGVAGMWPDPLPPFDAPVDVEAATNQPIWVRITAPKDAAAGMYEGVLRLAAEGYSAEAPLMVEVFDFDMPDRMTCTTAFGFTAGTVFRYHGVTDPVQQRQVLDLYLDNFAAHRISPYDPAPLDGFEVQWPGLGSWQGGERDTSLMHGGASALRLADTSETANVGASYAVPMDIPGGGLRIRFWYRTAAEGQDCLLSLGHYDAAGDWMSGRNNDIVFTGDGAWQQFDRTFTQFPEGATAFTPRFWGARWREDGSTIGTLWIDDVIVSDAATGGALVEEGFEPLEPQRLKPVFDWSAWDAAMTVSLDQRHFNSFRLPIPGLGGGTFHSRTDPSLLGFSENTPEYRAAFTYYCQAVQDHLREKGWLDEAYVYWFDEPDPKDYEFVMNGFSKLKEAAPDINRMLTEQVEPALIGGPNIWCPVTPDYDYEAAEARRAEGEKFWWYVCTGPKEPYATLFIDHPGTEMRVWLWQTWQNEVEGILIWTSNYWTSDIAYPDSLQNPYEDPMSWVTGYGTPSGSRRPWGNGDGRFVYPPLAAANGAPAEPLIAGPVDSMRWEMLRDGLEDYEYLAMLSRLLEEKGASLKAHEKRVYEELLRVPESISADMVTFTWDPAPIERRRNDIAAAIADLQRR